LSTLVIHVLKSQKNSSRA